MVSEDKDSLNDLRYALKDAGFAYELGEAARAFSYAGIGGEAVAAPVVKLVQENDRITVKDVEQMIDAVVARSGGDRSDPNIERYIAELRNSIGASRSEIDGLRRMAENVVQIVAANRFDANSPELREARMQQLWAQYDALSKKVDGHFEALGEWLTEDEKEQRKDNQARIDAAWNKYNNATTPEAKAAALQDLHSAAQAQTQYDTDLKDNIDKRSGGTAPTHDLGKDIDARANAFNSYEQLATVSKDEVALRPQALPERSANVRITDPAVQPAPAVRAATEEAPLDFFAAVAPAAPAPAVAANTADQTALAAQVLQQFTMAEASPAQNVAPLNVVSVASSEAGAALKF